MSKRIFVENKKGFDVEARELLQDFKTNLGISALEGIRIFVRYDCEGLGEQEYQKAKNIVFFEPPTDKIYEEEIPEIQNVTIFAVEYLPGQYDSRADFAEQTLKVVNPDSVAKVRVGKVIALIGNLTEQDLAKIKKYYINPVEMQETPLEKSKLMPITTSESDAVPRIENFGADKIDELGLAMSAEDAEYCANYFRSEGRAPTLTEIRVLDTYWSDHCRHTTFLTELENVEIEPDYIKKVYDDLKPKSLMDAATRAGKTLAKAGKLPELDISEEVNACSIEVEIEVNGKPEPWLIMFKNETHNHPTEIEPFGGASTCLGGAIRDPLSGRSYVYQAMRITGSGDPRTKIEDTIPGKIPQRTITTKAAEGYSSYGNQIGVSAGQLVEIYDEGYVAKRMELGAVVAAAPKENVVRNTPAPTDVIILIGGKTGRDGCGGATSSSKTHDAKTTVERGADVQKGNPPAERSIVRLFRNKEATQLIKKCNDFGAGGVCVAIGELAAGLSINLDAVPTKYDGLSGTELAISESQERMAVVVSAKDADKFMALADAESIEATIVAEVTAEPRLVMHWRGDKIVDISREFLDSSGVMRKSTARIETPDVSTFFAPQESKDKTIMKHISSLNFCSQKAIVEMFDSTAGANAVLFPLGGKNQLTPPDCMVAKVPVLHGETDACTFMSYAYTPKLAKLSPFHSACYAVLESIAKIVATGGDWKTAYFSFQEVFEKLGDEPLRWGKPLGALLGAYYAQMQFERAAIGGKDSMSGSYITENERIDVPPALVSFAITVGDANVAVSPEFKKAGSKLVLVEIPRYKNHIPDFDVAKSSYDKIHELIKEKRVLSAHSLGAKGLISSIVQCFGNEIGAQINKEEDLYVPRIGDILLEVASSEGIGFGREIGKTTSEKTFVHGDEVVNLDDAIKAWSSTLSDVFKTSEAALAEVAKTNPETIVPEKVSFKTPNIIKASGKFAKPRVFIPVFPGTSCEYDSSLAFERAGAEVDIVVMRTLTKSHFEQTIEEMKKTIDSSQIIMLPGGMSASDEPDGAAKYITAVLRNPKIEDSIMRFIKERDGLILGIGNGFQALIKLGLVPYGEIRALTEDSPTLAKNPHGKHISKMVKTRIASNLSPWLFGMNIDDEYVIPLSSGESRFVASAEIIKELITNGQIATQYVDNPNGSVMNVEGITNIDGRIFGKMGHSERAGSNVCKNIIGDTNQNIFKNGVEYFK